MPIQLTKAISGGDLELAPLSHAKITRLVVGFEEQQIHIEVQLGSMNGVEFIPCKTRVSDLTIKDLVIAGEDYQLLEPKALEVATRLYQWLLDNGHLAGTVA